MSDINYTVEVTPLGTIQIPGPPGSSGQSAYAIAVANGFVGTQAQWLASLDGESAYQVWLGLGNSGDQSTFINSLDGESAYQVWLDQGNTGDESNFLATLIGDPGQSAYQIWLSLGNSGTEASFISSLTGLTGPSGQSAYAIAVANGFVGTQAQWLASLKGPSGTNQWSQLIGVPSTFPPSPHTHPETDIVGLIQSINGINATNIPTSESITGGGHLSGLASITLVNDQSAPGNLYFYGTDNTGTKGWIHYGTGALANTPSTGNASSVQVVLGNDTRLSNARTPLAHGLTHGTAGSDPISIVKAQISDLPGVVTTTLAGFVPTLPTSNQNLLYFRGDGSWSTVTVGSGISVNWSAIVGAPLATLAVPGLVPGLSPVPDFPGSGGQTHTWLRGDNSWQLLPNTAYISQSFNVPSVGNTVTVNVIPYVSWPQTPITAFFSDGSTQGFLEITSTAPSSPPYTAVTLTNQGYLINKSPGTPVNAPCALRLQGPSLVSSTTAGLLPAFPGGTSIYLRGDGTYSSIPYSGLTGTPSSFTPSAHAATHAHGGSDPVTITYSDLASIPSSFNPSAHHATHAHGGSDPVSITYSDLLSIPSTFAPSAHAASHTSGSDLLAYATTSARGVVPPLVTAGSGAGQQGTVWLRGDDTWQPIVSGGTTLSYYWNDFLGSALSSDFTTAGTGTKVLDVNNLSGADHPGVLVLSPVTTASTFATAYLGALYLGSPNTITFRALVNPQNFSGTATWFLWMGLLNAIGSVPGTLNTASIYGGVNGVNWKTRVGNSSTSGTDTDSGVLVTAGNWYDIKIVASQNGVSYYINNNFITTVTANLPTAIALYPYICSANGTAITTYKALFDFVELSVTTAVNRAIITPV